MTLYRFGVAAAVFVSALLLILLGMVTLGSLGVGPWAPLAAAEAFPLQYSQV